VLALHTPYVDHLPGGRVLAGPFFVVAMVLMASVPWVLLQPGQQTWGNASLVMAIVTVVASISAVAARLAT
jgi:hypothetical protein